MISSSSKRWALQAIGLFVFLGGAPAEPLPAQTRDSAELWRIPELRSSWDDLHHGITTREQWRAHRVNLIQRYLRLLRDEHKPVKPPLALECHETVEVDHAYTRRLISYNVETGERAHAYLGIPIRADGAQLRLPAVVALHGTHEQGAKQAAGLLEKELDYAYLDHLCRRGYVVIAPEHFVSGHRIPPAGPYETSRFYERHPEWTAVGKFTYEHAIAIDVLQSLPEVDPTRIGVLGHSLGGHGTFFLAAYDERVQAAACNCGASFFRHNPAVTEWARDRWYVYFKPLRSDLLQKRLPDIDFHEIISLIAPRAFLDVSGLNDGPAGTQRQRVLMLTKIMDTYEFEGVPEKFAFFVHGAGHAVPHTSRELMYAWMDMHIAGTR